MGKTFLCSECNYATNIKCNVQNHIIKKCPYANIVTETVDIKCEHCNKEYSVKRSLDRHLKICKVLKDTREAEQAAEIIQLKQKLAESEAKRQTTNITNNNTYNIQVVNGYRQTDFEHLKDGHYRRAIGRMIYSVPQMIEDVHFNSKAPENHNIYIKNIKNKYAMVYDGLQWNAKDKDQVIDQLINDQEYAIEEWLGEGDKFPKEMKKFNEYLEKKGGPQGDEIKDIIKEEVKLLLYNNRGKISHVS